MRAAHINAGWPADFDGDGARGVSDHDPQVARFRSRASLTVADVTVAEGNSGTTPADVHRSRVPAAVAAGRWSARRRWAHRVGPSDYNGLAQCKTLAAGATSLTFTVTVRGDRRREANEQFALLVVGVPYVRPGRPDGESAPSPTTTEWTT